MGSLCWSQSGLGSTVPDGHVCKPACHACACLSLTVSLSVYMPEQGSSHAALAACPVPNPLSLLFVHSFLMRSVQSPFASNTANASSWHLIPPASHSSLLTGPLYPATLDPGGACRKTWAKHGRHHGTSET